MKRRIIIILIIVGILGGITAGTWLYLRRSSGPKLLARAELAIRAEKFPKAMDLAEKYITKHPADWRGYYVKAQALIHLGRHADARKALAEAGRLNPGEVSISITLAKSYSLPANESMASRKAIIDPAVLDEAIRQFNQANEILLKVRTSGPKRAMEVQQNVSRNYQRIALAWRVVGGRLAREARIAKASRDDKLAVARRKESNAASDKSDEAADQAIKTLLEVVRKDASRPIAARVLVDLCIREIGQAEVNLRKDEKVDPKRAAQQRERIRRNKESLTAAGKAIMALNVKSRPPVAVLKLAKYKLGTSISDADSAGRRKLWDEYRSTLNGLLEEHPDQLEVRLARVEALIDLVNTDLEMARRLCNLEKEKDATRGKILETTGGFCKEILKDNPGLGQALLVRAKLLILQRKTADAERILFRLTPKSLRGRDRRFAVDVHITYALAARAIGKKESAHKAMRTVVTKIDPDNAYARRYLAASLLQDGHYQQAFTDAQEYYRAHPGDPAAIGLFVKTAKHTDQPELAKKTLEEAEEKFKDNPAMLVVVAEGYVFLEKKREAQQAFDKAARCKPVTTEDCFAVARAKMRIGLVSEAEKTLIDELAREPKQPRPRVHFKLGQLYLATGRRLQAIEQFRAAVRIDDLNDDYRLVLARTLFDSGDPDDLEQCQITLDRIDPANDEANLLRLKLRDLRSEEHVPVDQMLRQFRETGRAGLGLATDYLNSGRPEDCVKVCLDELKKTPDDQGLRFLLGRAYLLQGRRDECLDQWKAVLKASPEQLPIYVRIAGVLAEKIGPQEVEKALLAIPGANRDMIDLTIGRLLARMGDFKASAEVYDRLIDRAESSEFFRNRARLLRARMLAADGGVDQAIAELDKLARTPAWRRTATEAKAAVMFAADRRKEASVLLAQLCRTATEEKDAAALRRIAGLYVRIEQIEEALAVCDSAERLFPNDAASYLLRAAVLSEAGRRSESLPLLQKAIDLQPGNVRTYLTLVRMLDAEHQSVQALEVLKRMGKLGQAGRATALYEQGLLFARWGLYTQALRCFQEIVAEGYTSIPKIQLAIGRAFAGLGQKDRAGDLLKSISVYSPQYVTAQWLLAEIAETDEVKLNILDRLEKVRAGHAGVLVQKMKVLLDAGKPAEAVKAFHSFVSRHAKNRPMPTGAAYLAVQAMLAADDHGAASELASRMAKDTTAPRWRQLAILLNLDDKSDSAAKMLPSVEKAGLHDALLGLILSVQKDDATLIRKWAGRIDRINRRLAGMPKPRAIPSHYRLLVALAAGRVSQAETELANYKSIGEVSRNAVAELVRRARGDTKAAAEAANLLKASVAIDLGLAPVGKSWAMEVLKARPKCQWAAALIIKSRPDPATLRVLLETIRPEDCVLARVIRASLLLNEGEYEKAAEVYRKAAEVEKDSLYLVLAQATATENAGRLAEALSLYRKVWQATRNPMAANNAAYLVSQLYPRDAVRLDEALRWSEAAIEAAPLAVAFHDTKGWIAFLLGKKEQARLEVRRAVKGLPRSPEVHYHLGVIETDAGNRDLGRWHLAAAVSTAEAIKTDGRKLTVAEDQAARLAKAALAEADHGESKQ